MTAIDFAAFVDELAAVSGETIRPFFRSALSVENKSQAGGFDPVTAADRAAETAMRALIKKTFPAHGIVGEEFPADCLGARALSERLIEGTLALHPEAGICWTLLALSGGHPVTLAGEWTPRGLWPLTAWDEDGRAVPL